MKETTLKNPLKTIEARYDEFATNYVSIWSRLEGYSGHVKAFLRDAVRPGSRVLDVGCGPGHLTAELADGVDVVGLDLSASMLEAARASRPSGTYAQHSYYDPVPAELGRFDVVVAVGALDFCEDLDRVLKHLSDAARPGARLLVNLIERRAGVRGHESHRLPITPERMPGVDLIFYTLEEMAGAIARAGLVANTYCHYKGYRNQYHELDIQYALWDLSKPGEAGSTWIDAAH